MVSRPAAIRCKMHFTCCWNLRTQHPPQGYVAKPSIDMSSTHLVPFQSMSTMMRPKEIATWMKRHRKPETPKDIELDTFEVALLAWWHALQPAWRVTSDVTPTTFEHTGDTDDGWDTMRRGGPNGFCLVIVAISWYVSTNGNQPLSLSMTHLLDDTAWVLRKLIDISPDAIGKNAENPSLSTHQSKRKNPEGASNGAKR